MSGYKTILNPAEIAVADLLAQMRNDNSVAAGCSPAFGAPSNVGGGSFGPNQVGSRGELVTARLLDLYPNMSVRWEEKETGFDLSHQIGVRSAQKRHGLLVRPGDPDEGRFVAVFVNGAHLAVLGWEYGGDAKDRRWLSSPGGRDPCYLKPEKRLRPMSELMALVAHERATRWPLEAAA